jgi:cytochrome c oxidase subunit II
VSSTQERFGDVQTLYLPIAAAVLVLVFGWMAVALVRYRARPGREPSPTQDHFVREGAIATVVAGIVVVLLIVTLNANGDITRVRPRPTWRVDVTAYKWGWQFRYPALPGVVDRTTEGQGPPVLHVPADRTVQVTLHTLDITHAFWVPAVRFKRDAWPGTRYVFDLRFPQGDAVSGRCAQYCGLHHADMIFTVAALGPGAFARWRARA